MPSTETPPAAGPPEPEKFESILAAADKVSADLTSKNDKYLRKLGRKTYYLLLLGAAIGIGSAYQTCPPSLSTSGCDFRSWGELSPARRSVIVTTLIALATLAFLSLVRKGSGGLRRLLIGKDGRFSTSAAQVAMWTTVIAYSLVFLILRSHLGGSAGFTDTFDELDGSYLLLLGGPFAAAAISRASTSSKVESGELQKTAAKETKLGDLISDDNGNPDLVDTQFFAFNIVVLVYFVAAITKHPTALPDLPLGLVGLTSGSALAYTGDKIAERNAPVITAITKRDGTGGIRPGDEIVILGANFIPPGGGRADLLTRVRVKFGATEAPVLPDDLKNPTNLRTDRIAVKVPATVPAENIQVTVATAANIESSPYSLQILPDVPVITGAAPLPVRKGKDLVITGRFFQRPGVPGEAAVFMGSVPVPTSNTTGSKVVAHVPDIGLGATVAITVQAFGGIEPSAPVTLPVRSRT